MAFRSIQASVGMYENGTRNCFNLPSDVATIVELLNQTGDDIGGSSASPISVPATARTLYQAIFAFQNKQNALGNTPRLSVDGHVDPGQETLKRLNAVSVPPGPFNPGPGPGPTSIAVIPFSEPVPLLISSRPHNPAKNDLKSTPTPTSVFPAVLRVEMEGVRRLSTGDLETAMTAELTTGGGLIGASMALDFFSNLAVLGTITHGSGRPLSELVKNSPEFRDAHDDVTDSIRSVVSAGALRGIIDYHDLAEPKKKVPPPGLGFSGFQQLHVLIGSFQGVAIFLNDFSADPSKATYSADLTYHFFDHFGVDDSDVNFDFHGHGSPGQKAFWVLQRERHPGHMPYIVEVVINKPIVNDSF